MNDIRKFHIGDLLSITSGRLVAPYGMGAIHRLLVHMTGDELDRHQIPRAARECKSWLLRWFPFLGRPEVIEECDRLGDTVKDMEPGLAARYVEVWLELTARFHGEWFDVGQIPRDDHEAIEAVTGAVQMCGPDGVAPIKYPDSSTCEEDNRR